MVSKAAEWPSRPSALTLPGLLGAWGCLFSYLSLEQKLLLMTLFLLSDLQ